MIFTIICFYWGFDNKTETVLVCNLWPLSFRPSGPILRECDRYLCLESNFVRDEEIIHIIWVPWMASVNLMTHLTLSSLHKMSTKKCREEGGCRLWCNWAPTSFVAHSYLGERPRSNKVTMSGDTPPKSGHNNVHNASIMNTWEKSQGGTILGAYQPISQPQWRKKGGRYDSYLLHYVQIHSSDWKERGSVN